MVSQVSNDWVRHSDDQDYVTDFWDTFTKEEKAQLIKEGFKAPNTKCELFVVDFVGLGDVIAWRYI